MIRILVIMICVLPLGCRRGLMYADTSSVELRIVHDRLDYTTGDTLCLEVEVANHDTVALRLPFVMYTFWLEVVPPPDDSFSSQFVCGWPNEMHNFASGSDLEWTTIEPDSTRRMTLQYIPDDLSVLGLGSVEFSLRYKLTMRGHKDTLYNIVSKNRLILEIK